MYLYQQKATIVRDFILLFLIIFVVLLFVAFAVAYKTYDYYAHEVISDLKKEHARIDRTLHSEMRFASYVMESLARQLVHDDYAENPQHIASLLGSFYDGGKDYPFHELMWVNQQQHVVITSRHGILDVPYTVEDRDHIKKALSAPWQPHVGRPMKGSQGDQWFLPISLGVTDMHGAFIGILTLTFDIQHFTQKLRSVIQKEGVEFAVFTRTLTFVTDSIQQNLPLVPLRQEMLSEFYKSAEQSHSATILSLPSLFHRDRSFAYYQDSRHYPYIFYITYDHEYFDEEIMSLLQARMIQIIFIAAFLFILLWIVRTRIMYPIEQLSEVTKSIISGKDLPFIPRGGSLEIEHLGNDIRKLSNCIEEQKRVAHELKLKNQYLGRMKETSDLLTRSRSEFLSQAAQEIQKPLTRLHQRILELLEYEHRTPSYVEQINELSSFAHQLNQMLEDVKYVARTEYNSLILRENSVHMNFSLHRAVRQFHEIPSFRHVNIKLRCEEQLPSVMMDEDRFLQLIVTLLCGASTHIVQGTSIELSAHIEFNEHISKELVIQIKYNAHHLISPSDLLATKTFDQSTARTATNNTASRVVHETICFTLARMLVSLYQGEMTISSSKNEMHTIYLRFPKNIMVD